MALPEKVANKPCKECENVKEIKVKEEGEPEVKEIKIEEEEKMIIKEEKPTEDDGERKENIKPFLVNQYCPLPPLVNFLHTLKIC